MTPKDREEADQFLSSVVSSVLQTVTSEEKDACLYASLYYDIFAAHFGTRTLSHPQKQVQARLRQHDKASTLLKNKATGSS